MKREQTDSLEYSPQELDLNHHGLSDLFCSAAIEIDNYVLKKDNFNFKPVARVGKIFYMATELGTNSQYPDWIPARDDAPLSVFLLDSFKTYVGKRLRTIDEVVSQTKQVALDFIKMKELPKEKQENLRGLAVELSKKARSYWHSINPTGFRRCVA